MKSSVSPILGCIFNTTSPIHSKPPIKDEIKNKKKLKKKHFSSELCFVRWCLVNLPPLLVRLQIDFGLV